MPRTIYLSCRATDACNSHCGRTNDLSIDAVEADATERMAIRLHHLDIPVLSTAGLLAYDAESRLVVYTATDVTDQYASRSGSEPRQLSTL